MMVLIVDDEKNILDLLQQYLEIEGIQSMGAENGLSAQRMLKERPYDAMLVDLKMPGLDGIQLIEWTRNEGLHLPIIMMSAHGEIADAVTALKEGAQDYVVKPFDPEELVAKLKKLVEAQQLQEMVALAGKEEGEDAAFIGKSPQIQKIKALIRRIQDSSSTILITGESGTGKEVVARAIHSSSRQKDGPFVAINIGGVPENLLESELFGYEKGAFTGAVVRKSGKFELAHGGTLFLDEIGDMPLALQVKILRVLQERKITRLGGTTPMPIDARIVAATNKNLEAMVQEGKFREDLFYRLNVVRIQIPPLRERKEDIPLLAAGILSRLNAQVGHKVKGFTADALQALCSYAFYGNVRELENILERAVIFCQGDEIAVDDLDLDGGAFAKEQKHMPREQMVKSLKDIELDAIVQSLRRWEGNRTKAAKELGISRRTLINKIQEYGLEEL